MMNRRSFLRGGVALLAAAPVAVVACKLDTSRAIPEVTPTGSGIADTLFSDAECHYGEMYVDPFHGIEVGDTITIDGVPDTFKVLSLKGGRTLRIERLQAETRSRAKADQDFYYGQVSSWENKRNQRKLNQQMSRMVNRLVS